MVSEAKIDANRRNAQASSGPKTPEGKARSALNGLTHGLTAETLVLPTEDGAVVARRRDAFRDDLQPRGAVESYLVDRLVGATVKLDRCDRGAFATLQIRIAGASDQCDADAVAHARDLFDRLGSPGTQDIPLKIADQLVRTEEGVELALQFWRRLRERGNWHLPNQDRAFWLLGTETYRVYDDPVVAAVVAAQVVLDCGGQDMMVNRLKEITRAHDWPKFRANRDALKKSLPRPEEAVQTMTDLADGAIARLEALLPGLQARAAERRQLAALAAQADEDAAALRRQRYASAATRELHQTLGELRRQQKARRERKDDGDSVDICTEIVESLEVAPVLPHEQVVLVQEVAPNQGGEAVAARTEPTATADQTEEMFTESRE